ncbi:uncharacterized protein Dwil_GK25661 [Drosophila willistoni]|uniref:Uncharacterized protein n=1 Tax=Drosophila willistoni TaxID=7260 RepID=B4NEK9_DROWI|nr:uncharacterized protein Dwil_GK25661 [Drosophila willistoni]
MSIACTQARPGGPAAYSISAPSVDHASVGNTQEHTVKGHYGQSSQSDYASQVQTAHSQSHVQRSSISNDAGLAPAAHYAAAPAHQGLGLGLGLGHAGHGYAVAAAPAPILAYGGHYGATAPATLGGHAQLGLGLGLGYAGYAGSIGGYGYSAAAPAYSHGYLAAAPAPVVKYAAAPAYAPSIIGHGIGLAGHAAIAAPAYATHLAAAPVVKAIGAPALVHTSVSGHGIQYGY